MTTDQTAEEERDRLTDRSYKIGYSNYSSDNPSRSPIVGLPAELQPESTWRNEIFTAYNNGFDQAADDAAAAVLEG